MVEGERMTREIIIRIQIPDGLQTPDVGYEDGQPYLVDAPLPPLPTYDRDEIARPVAPPAIPECPQHGPMTFYATKKDGTPFPRYSCPARMPDGSFCPTKMVPVK
jgi:hypothetical protein